MTLSERIIQDAADAIVVASSDGTITLWNPAAERLFGHAAAEAVGKSLDLIVPERHRARHWAGYKEVMRTGTTHYGTQVLRVPAVRKDGSQVSIAFTVGLLTAADGRVEAILAVLRDDSERWNTEKALRQKVAGLEKAAGAPRGTEESGSMRIERGASGALVASLRDARATGGTLTAALRLGDQEWRLVLEAGEISALHTAIHEWFKAQQAGREGPGRSEG